MGAARQVALAYAAYAADNEDDLIVGMYKVAPPGRIDDTFARRRHRAAQAALPVAPDLVPRRRRPGHDLRRVRGRAPRRRPRAGHDRPRRVAVPAERLPVLRRQRPLPRGLPAGRPARPAVPGHDPHVADPPAEPHDRLRLDPGRGLGRDRHRPQRGLVPHRVARVGSDRAVRRGLRALERRDVHRGLAPPSRSATSTPATPDASSPRCPTGTPSSRRRRSCAT